MEQLIDPEGILRDAQVEPNADTLESAKSWTRINEVEFDPVVLQRNHIVTQTPSTASAPFDQMRTRLLHHMRKFGHRKLAVTSAHHGAGNSTLVANLALSFARQSEFKVMVFDFDLRAPSLIHLFGLVAPGPRYSALLHHRRNFDSSCLRINDNLALSLNATEVDDAAEVLSRSKTSSLLNHIERDFAPDLMIFDLPALVPMDDACAGLCHSDCALVVAQADKTTVAQTDLAEQLVADRTTCLGVVLNQCRFGDASGVAP